MISEDMHSLEPISVFIKPTWQTLSPNLPAWPSPGPEKCAGELTILCSRTWPISEPLLLSLPYSVNPPVSFSILLRQLFQGVPIGGAQLSLPWMGVEMEAQFTGAYPFRFQTAPQLPLAGLPRVWAPSRITISELSILLFLRYWFWKPS